MAHDPAQPPQDDPHADRPERDDSTHFSWEFPAEDWGDYGPRRAAHAGERLGRGPRSDRSSRSSQAANGARSHRRTQADRVVDAETVRTRAAAIQRMLDDALDLWWRDGVLPTQRQLRDGLEGLAAGLELPEAQRTLLLRAALAHGRGILTALRYQTDPERVGLVMTEMLLDGLDAQTLLPFLDEKPAADGPVWRATLARELRLVLATGDPTQRTRARIAFETLFASELGERVGRQPEVGHQPEVLRPHALWMRRVLLVALALAFVGFALWQRFQWLPPAKMAVVPQGHYLLLGKEGLATVAVTSDGFFVDRHEVTNAEYRRCIERGACGWPVSNDSATRDDYLVMPAYADYPVVNVSVADAAAYCSWRDKRLPTEIEWEIAATGPPGTAPTAYPWGVTFDAQRANTLASEFGDTLMVGFFRPAGDSLFGVSDLAGNVAEWTITSPETDPTRQIVKGGSFRSESAAATVFAQEVVGANVGLAWVGFRCVRGPMTGQ